MSPSPNVLFLVVDACRADALAPYDGTSLAHLDADDRTPNVASFADDATTFRRAISPAPWTLPSVTSLLTGLYPHEHGATSRGFALDSGTTLQDDLGDQGYTTLHLSPKTWIGDWLPQGQGFDRVEEFTGPAHHYFDDGADVRRLSAGVTDGLEWYTTVARRALDSDAPLRSLANAAAFKVTEATGDAWLDDVRASETAARIADREFERFAGRDSPFFAYVHLMDPHLPFYVPSEYRTDDVRPPGCETLEDERAYLQELLADGWAIRLGERTLSEAEREFLRTRYADEVAYADHAVGEILDALDRRGLAEDTLVAITGDHGEHLGERVAGLPAKEWGERTLIDHQTSVGLPALHVPLLVRYPGEFDGGERADLVQSHYLAPTVRALAGLDYRQDRSLLPADAERTPERALAEYSGVVPYHPPAELEGDERLTATRRSAIVDRWKLDEIDGERRAVEVDWATGETTPVDVEAIPRSARNALEDTLAEPQATAAGADRDVPDEVAANLRGLGYMD